MTISERDRRALMILGGAAIVMGVIYFWPEPKVEVVGATSTSSVEQAAARLQQVRREAEQLPIREEWRKKSEADLAALEKGLIVAESLPQAQAQLLQIVRRVAKTESPALDLRGNDFNAPRAYGEHYAEVLLTLTLECQIEQLINFLADLSAQPELLSVDELHVGATTNKQKTVSVRMTVSGLARGSMLRPAGAGGRS